MIQLSKFYCIEWGWRPRRRINDYVTCVLQSLRIGISSAPTFGTEYGTQPYLFLSSMSHEVPYISYITIDSVFHRLCSSYFQGKCFMNSFLFLCQQKCDCFRQ